MSSVPSVIIAGVGNSIMQDDGIGVWAVRALVQDYILPPNIKLIEVGILGMQWIHELRTAHGLLIIDAMKGDGAPGTIYRLDGDTLLLKDRPTLVSLHELGLADILSVGNLLGWRPRTRIIGVQPLEVQQIGLELTPPLQEALPAIVNAVIDELENMEVQLSKQHHDYDLDHHDGNAS